VTASRKIQRVLAKGYERDTKLVFALFVASDMRIKEDWNAIKIPFY
jgi:hypothetical protein